MRFRSRVDAGRQLAGALKDFRGEDAIVYALPRGGVVVGREVARALGVPLDIVIVRKVGHPHNPEYAVCALGEGGVFLCNEEERGRIDPAVFEKLVRDEEKEAARRREVYTEGRKQRDPEGRIAILVDDGIATGLTLRAAIRELKRKNPKEVVVAVPVSPPDAAKEITREVDEFIALDIPQFYLGAVGAYYDEFPEVNDEEVIKALRA